MALTVNTNIRNDTDQYLLDAKNVKGGYIVVATIAERNNLPAATIVKGSLCYCQEDNKFYQYNGENWQIPNINIMQENNNEAYVKVENGNHAIALSAHTDSRGLYDSTGGQWLVQANKDNNEVTFKGHSIDLSTRAVTGGHARGLKWFHSDGEIFGAIGAHGENGTLSNFYIGFTSEPWSPENSLKINTDSIRWKGNELIHAGNIGSQNVSHAATAADCTGNAATATKLSTTAAGDTNTPVYFKDGVPAACTSLGLDTTGSSATLTIKGVTSAPSSAGVMEAITLSNTDLSIGGQSFPAYSKGFYVAGAEDAAILTISPQGSAFIAYRNGSTWHNGHYLIHNGNINDILSNLKASRIASGYYNGTGSSSYISDSVDLITGFKPKVVVVIGKTKYYGLLNDSTTEKSWYYGDITSTFVIGSSKILNTFTVSCGNQSPNVSSGISNNTTKHGSIILAKSYTRDNDTTDLVTDNGFTIPSYYLRTGGSTATLDVYGFASLLNIKSVINIAGTAANESSGLGYWWYAIG